jgi:hypothetical protein
MEVSGQLHAPAALTPKKLNQLSIESGAVVVAESVWTLWR